MRPVPIMLATIMLAVSGAVVLGAAVISGELGPGARQMLPSRGVMAVTGVVSLALAWGFWAMKKWVVATYAVLVVIQILVLGLSFYTEAPLLIVFLAVLSWGELG